MPDSNGNTAKSMNFPDRSRSPLEDSPSLNVPQKASFALFAMAIQSHQVEVASKILYEILGLDESDCVAASFYYYKQFSVDESIQMKALTINSTIESGQLLQGEKLLKQSFNLERESARQAMNYIKLHSSRS